MHCVALYILGGDHSCMKPELTEMDNSESCETNNRRADLIQLFPKAYRYAKLHLEADRAKAWKQQVRNLKGE